MFLTLFVATHVIILTSDLSTDPSQDGFTESLLPHMNGDTNVATRTTNLLTLRSATSAYALLSFGSWLEPRYIFAAGQLISTSELLRYL